MDPITLIGGALLTEGIKFLYGQATELLKRRRELRDAGDDQPAAEVVVQAPPGLLAEPVTSVVPDRAALERIGPELTRVWTALTPYGLGVADVPADEAAAAAVREQAA